MIALLKINPPQSNFPSISYEAESCVYLILIKNIIISYDILTFWTMRYLSFSHQFNCHNHPFCLKSIEFITITINHKFCKKECAFGQKLIICCSSADVIKFTNECLYGSERLYHYKYRFHV